MVQCVCGEEEDQERGAPVHEPGQGRSYPRGYGEVNDALRGRSRMLGRFWLPATPGLVSGLAVRPGQSPSSQHPELQLRQAPLRVLALHLRSTVQ